MAALRRQVARKLASAWSAPWPIRAVASAASLGAAAALYAALRDPFGEVAYVAYLAPAIVAGWALGPYMGFAFGLMTDAIADRVAGVRPSLRAEDMLFVASVAIVGAVVGSLSVATRRERDARQRVQAELATRDRLEASVRNSERLASVGTLVAGVGHEINNPLTYMQGHAELAIDALEALAARPTMLGDERAAIDDIRTNLGSVLRGTQRIAEITRGLRQVARRPTDVSTSFDLVELARGVVLVASGRLRGAAVEVDAPTSVQVRANEGEIAQILLNLLVNAGDALDGRPDARVRVRVRAARDHAILEVEDNGSGIPAAVRQRLFTPFFTTKPNGTGLGLSVSRQLAAKNDGSLSLATREGDGTTFTLALPAAAEQAPRRSSTAARADLFSARPQVS